METKTTSQEVYETIVELYNLLKSPIPLYLLYDWIRYRKRLGLSTKQIRGSLKYLFDSGKLKWAKEGHLIPSEFEEDNDDW